MTDDRQAVSTQVTNAMMREPATGGRFRYLGMAHRGTRWRVQLPTGTIRILDATDAQAWLRWLDIGTETAKARPPARRRIDPILPVLVNPTLANALRVEIRYRMEQVGLDMSQLAETIGRDRQTVGYSLAYDSDRKMSAAVAQDLAAGVGLDLHGWLRERYGDIDVAEAFRRGGFDLREVTADADAPAHVAPFGEAPPEPAAIRRARAAAIFHERGLIRWTGPLSPGEVQREPNIVRRATPFAWYRAGHSYEVPAEVVIPSLLGLGDAVDPDASAAITEG